MAEYPIIKKKIIVYYVNGITSSVFSRKVVDACRLSEVCSGLRGIYAVIVDKGKVYDLNSFCDVIPVYHAFIVFLPRNQRNKGLATIIQIATMFTSMYAMSYVGSWGWVKGLASTSKFFVKAVAGVLIGYGGGYLYNSFVPLPNEEDKPNLMPKPTYDINFRKNYFKTGSPVPDLYGRLRVYPCHAMTPYIEYHNNQKYFHFLYLVSHGYCRLKDLRFGESPLFGSMFDSFEGVPDVQIQFLSPDDQLHLFRDNIYVNKECAGLELEPNKEMGPFHVCSKVEKVLTIAVDIFFPDGICDINATHGWVNSRTISIDMKYRKIDEYDLPIDDEWFVDTFSFTNESIDGLGYTIKTHVPEGRYEVIFVSNDSHSQLQRGRSLIQSVKGIKDSKRVYGSKTLIAVKCRAIEGVDYDRFNVYAERCLKYWDNESKEWSEAFEPSTVMRTAVNLILFYNDDIFEEDIDWESVSSLDVRFGFIGYPGYKGYNVYLTESTSLLSALSDCLRVARIFYYISGGKISFVRDEPVDHVSCVFSKDNIITWQEEIGYVTNDLAKAVNVSYYDSQIEAQDIILCEPDNVPETGTVSTIKIHGITDREHAWREGKYQIESSLRRRHFLTLTVDLEGYIPIFHSRIKVFIDMPKGDVDLVKVRSRGIVLRIASGFDQFFLESFFVSDETYSIVANTSDSIGGGDFIGDFVLGSESFLVDGYNIYLEKEVDKDFIENSGYVKGYYFLRKSDMTLALFWFDFYSDSFYLERFLENSYSHVFLRSSNGSLSQEVPASLFSGFIVDTGIQVNTDISCVLFSEDLEGYNSDFQVLKIRQSGDNVELRVVNYVGIEDTGTMPARPLYSSVPMTEVEVSYHLAYRRSYEGLYNENSFSLTFPENNWWVCDEGVLRVKAKVLIDFYFFYLNIVEEPIGHPSDGLTKNHYHCHYTGYSFNLKLLTKSDGIWSTEVLFVENRSTDTCKSTYDRDDIEGFHPDVLVFEISSDTYTNGIEQFYFVLEVPSNNAPPIYPSKDKIGKNEIKFSLNKVTSYYKTEHAK